MGAVYPGAVKTFRARADSTDIAYAAHIGDLQDEVRALQATLGVDPHVDVGSDGARRAYADVGQRISRSGLPSITVEAYATAPFFLPRVDHGGFGDRGQYDVTSTRWDVVRTTAAGGAPVEEVCVPFFSLPAGRTWLTTLWVGGIAKFTGTATVSLVGRYLFTRASPAPPSVRYIGSSYVENTTTSVTHRQGDDGYRNASLVRPPGEGWTLTKASSTSSYRADATSAAAVAGNYITRQASWTRVQPPFKVTQKRSSYHTQEILARVRDFTVPTVAGEPFAIAATDLSMQPLAPQAGRATNTLDRYPFQPIATRFLVEGVGSDRGQMRLSAVTTDTGGA